MHGLITRYYRGSDRIVRPVRVYVNPGVGAVPPHLRGTVRMDEGEGEFEAPVMAYPDERGVRYDGYRLYKTAEEAETY